MTKTSSYADRFVAELDRLVRSLAEGPHRVGEQKAALRALREAARAGEVTILASGEALIANGVPVGGDAPTPDGLAGRMAGHGVPRVFVARDAEATDLLAAARALAVAPVEGDGPAALDLRTVRFSRTLAPPRVTPAVEGVHLAAAARQAPLGPHHLVAAEAAEEPAVVDDAPAPDGLVPGGEHSRALLADDPWPERELDDEALVARLSRAEAVGDMRPVLDEIVARADAAARGGDVDRVRALVTAAVRREEATADTELRLTLHVSLRRLLAVTHLRLLTPLLPRQPERRDDLMLVLVRAGEEGADVLIEHLVAAQSPSDRRVYFNALVRLQAGVPALVHMLGDPRWYVVRNAAELLGELEVQEADEPLARALSHDDERVRRAAANALGRLATGHACHALRDALRDPGASVRAQVANALAISGWPYATATLRRALGDEQDDGARRAIIAALGRIASDEAVGTLIELAEPARGLFRRRSTPLRTAVVHALVEANTPRAQEALARLAKDRDPEVREVAKGVGGGV